MTPLHSPLRWWGVALLVVIAAVHVPLIPSHLQEAPYVGVLFIALVVTCVALVVLLALRDSRTVWTAAGVVALLALLAFLSSRTVGLPQLGDDIGNWTDPLGFPALVAEALATALAVSVLNHTTDARKMHS